MLPGCRQGMCSAEATWEGWVASQKGANFGGLLSSGSRFLNADADLVGIGQGRAGARASFLIPSFLIPFCFKAEKKKGRSATFYPLDNTPFLLPVDETQPPALNSSMEPVGVSTEMALLSNILAAYAFITGRFCGCHFSGLSQALCGPSIEPTFRSHLGLNLPLWTVYVFHSSLSKFSLESPDEGSSSRQYITGFIVLCFPLDLLSSEVKYNVILHVVLFLMLHFPGDQSLAH